MSEKRDLIKDFKVISEKPCDFSEVKVAKITALEWVRRAMEAEAELEAFRHEVGQLRAENDRVLDEVWEEREKFEETIKRHGEIFGELRAENTSLREQLKQAEAQAEAMREASVEAMREIEYWHGDMLTEEERNHPRGSGWARVYDRIKNTLSSDGQAYAEKYRRMEEALQYIAANEECRREFELKMLQFKMGFGFNREEQEKRMNDYCGPCKCAKCIAKAALEVPGEFKETESGVLK